MLHADPELEPATDGVAVTAAEQPSPQAARSRRRLDRFDASMLAIFGLLSVWLLGVDLWHVVADGRTWTGTDGVYIVDQMQYLAWIRDASHHVLGSNLFVLRPGPHDYFLPPLTISGGLTALGVAPWLSYLLWKPVAVVAVFAGARAYVRRGSASIGARRAALVLALFFGSFVSTYGSTGVIGDLFPAFLSWGYPFALIGIGALAGALVAYERSRETGRRIWVAPVLGAVASSLHPWQGETVLLVIVGSELLLWRSPSRIKRLGIPLVTLGVTVLPLAYYWVLGRSDLSWKLARDASHHVFPLSAIAVGLLPLLVPAAIACARRPRTFFEVATRMWPLASVTIFVLSGTAVSATPLHAFDGITIPLAVLAVEGVRRLGWERLPRATVLAAIVLVVCTVPAAWWTLKTGRTLAKPGSGNPNFIHGSEDRALSWLDADPRPGGVLTRFYLGTIVPERTGRQTYVGHCLWSEPDCNGRAAEARALLRGQLQPAAAVKFVASTGARFVLTDCKANADLSAALRPIVNGVHRFGCSTVYEVAP